MHKENENLKIVSLKEILSEKLHIPGYQRPYRWSKESSATLVTDIYEAWINHVPEYRMGTVVLHKHDNKLDIVDGQQRLTTLAIIMFCIMERTGKEKYTNSVSLLNAEYKPLSENAIVDNYEIIRRKLSEIKSNDLGEYADYLLNNCTIVKIITENEQEAFQFFDSQNSRGKELKPQDLLKSYHLREMRDDPEEAKVKLINTWENMKQDELEIIFAENLYPLVNWYKGKDGLYYSSKKISTFKGIKKDSHYNFSVYHRAANLYIEHFNDEGMYELVSGKRFCQFQLTQPLISGKRFFMYCIHYVTLYKEVERRIDFKFNPSEVPANGPGDAYIKNLFVNVIMFFADKFGMEALTDARLNLLYKWVYSLRLVMKAVYKESINRYALGSNDRIAGNINMFSVICEMQEPAELDTIILDPVTRKQFEESKVNKTRYEQIFTKLEGA
ncbi:MAG TPA: DUF262 domain-containing protein [Ruminococcus flavefaciens]|nr:DUF262 domain-containing protein [Ruminococcus flavefaciens]